jgi:hypothetical protein
MPLHPLDTLYQACRRYPGGIEALAQRLHMSYDTLRKKLRHQVETHHLAYDEELSEILFCLDEAKVSDWDGTLHALCWRHGGLFVPLPALADGADDEGMTEAICESVKEHAEAVAAIGESLKPDRQGKRRIDAAEFQYIERQIEEAMGTLVAMRDRARRRHEADFPPQTKALKR